MESSDGADTYVVTTMDQRCQYKDCVPQCTASECTYLCRHQIECTCLDYQEGHLCKHSHKVKAMSNNADCDTKNTPQAIFNPPDRDQEG